MNSSRFLTYVACPYSHSDPEVRLRRFNIATAAASHLMSQGRIVYSPLTHCHPIAVAHGLPTDWAYWKQNCTTFLSATQEVVVVKAEGWEQSVGLKAELEIAKEIGIPVTYIDWP